MTIFYKSKFENRLKRYTTSQKVSIKFEIEKIAKNPYIGESFYKELGDYSGCQVHGSRFKVRILTVNVEP